MLEARNPAMNRVCGESIIFRKGDDRRGFLGHLPEIPDRFEAAVQGRWRTCRRLHGIPDTSSCKGRGQMP
jgi:hypothetical protein